jgi:DNA-binding transcriptional ArsR family regulator
MVKYSDETLDRTFAAIADPTRRALLARLGERQLSSRQEGISVSELAQPFAMSLPAIMKHLDVLSDAGLVARVKTGRVVACRLTARPMAQAMQWLNWYQRFWSEQLDRLAAFVEEEEWLPNQPRPETAYPQRGQPLRSPAASEPRRRKSTRRGPIRKK